MGRALLLGVLGLVACGADRRDAFGPGETPGASATPDPEPPGSMLFPEAGAPAPAPPGPLVNLIANGDFEQGNTSFASDYAYASPTNSAEGQYTVGLTGQAFNGALVTAGDHTTGSGLMFIGNGKATPDRVWFLSTPIAVTPNTKYFFEAWVMNLCCSHLTQPSGPSELSFYANDALLGTRTSTKLGIWDGLSTVWDSGSATTVTLKLVNANTVAYGNDFAVDDVFLGTESSIPPPK
jgi:hypothetical protein